MARTRKAGSDQRPSVEDAIMRLAAAQHGVVTRAQFLHSGVPADVVDRRLKTGRIRPVHRGVYVVGPIPGPHALEMAAVLACGESAVLSYSSAAALWGVLPPRDGHGPVEVSIVRGDHSRRPGLRVHRAPTLRPDETTKLDRVPVTKVARTLYDLASGSRHQVERAFAHAMRRGLTHRAELLSLLPRHSRRPGVSRVRALLDSEAQLPATRSEAEDRFLALVRKAKLPSPAVNATVAGYEVDFFWRTERFVVEVDGFAYHSSAAEFESDRRRDAVLAAAGIRVIRVTWRQLVSEPEALLVSVAQALARKGFQ